jgi:protein-disulfide isomerase
MLMNRVRIKAFLVALTSIGFLAACQQGASSRVARLESRLDSLDLVVRRMQTALAAGATSGTPETLTVSAIGSAAQGRDNAPVTIVEFTDYQCPFCRRHAQTTLPAIDSAYIARGSVRYVLRDLPLGIHPLAFEAAKAARCAGQQNPDKFWAYHDRVFQAQTGLSDSTLSRVAAEVGLNMAHFDQCRTAQETAAAVRADIAEAQRLGLTGTPSFLVGRTQGESVRGVLIRGAYPYERFKSVIDAALSTAGGTGS